MDNLNNKRDDRITTTNPNYMGQQNPNVNNQSDDYGVMAVAGFICAFVIFPVGLILSIIGLKDCVDNNRKGRGLARAGIWISALQLAFWLFLFIMAIVFGFEEVIEEHQLD